jgi:hypothetical protein
MSCTRLDDSIYILAFPSPAPSLHPCGRRAVYLPHKAGSLLLHRWPGSKTRKVPSVTIGGGLTGWRLFYRARGVHQS